MPDFYPDASPESTSVDGYSQKADTQTSSATAWANARGATTGDSADDSGTTGLVAASMALSGRNYTATIDRGFLLFDTSSIGSGATITAATLYVYISTVTNNDSAALAVVGSTPASNTAIVTADFDQVGTTRFASDWSLAAFGGGGYVGFSLNASGLAAINKVGITKMGLRLDRDLDNSEPTGVNSVTWRTADYTGSTNDPYLSVTLATNPPTTYWFM